MRPNIVVRLFSVTTLVLVVLAVASPTLAFQSGAGLFRDAAKMPALDRANERAVVRTRYVEVNLDVLPGARGRAAPGSSVLLNLFANRAMTAVLDHVENKPNGMIWVGSLQGINLSSVNLVTEGRVMVGSISYPGGMYGIRYAGNGVHAIVEIDQSQYPPEPAAIPTRPLARDSYAPAPGAPADTADTIDVMVLYTPAFESAAGGTAAANALVDLGISQTNTSYANSGITQRVNLVYKGPVSYTEPGTGSYADWDTALDDVTFGTGGLSGVAALRDAYAADVVSLFTNWSAKNYCGLGWYMDTVSAGFAPYAFTVVERTCIDGYYSFAHEMGHNMGAHHAWYEMSSPGGTPYTYAHGRANLSGAWRTIMAYNDVCSAQSPPFNCTRIQYWSNPGLTYGGAPLGVPGGTKSDATCIENATNPACDADNHLVLNNTALTVANFRQHVTGETVQVYLPLIIKSAAPPSDSISGKLNQAGVAASGVPLDLRFFNGSTYSTVASTSTNASGNYQFTGVPALAAGQSYYVRYINSGNSSRVSSWGSRDITSYGPTTVVNLGTSDLANIPMVSPNGGVTVALPYPFQWTQRGATPTDSYFWRVFDPSDGNPYAATVLLGYVSGVTITSIPTSFSPYVPYGWGVGVRDLNGGYGYSYYYRSITFTSLGTDLPGALDVKPRLAAPPDDRLVLPQRER